MPSKDLSRRTAKHARWVARNKEKVLAYERQRYKEERERGKPRINYLKKYGITEEQFNKMAAAQDYKCAICRKPQQGKKCTRLCVDHDHSTGEVRGLLCKACNVGLGYFRDDRFNLAEAIKYLTAHQGVTWYM